MEKKKHIRMFWLLMSIAILGSCHQTQEGVWYEDDIRLFPFQNDEERFVYVNNNGEEVINSSFFSADIFRDGVALVQGTNGKFGYINPNGEYVIDPKYDEATSFCDGIAWVTATNCPAQAINKKGKILFQFPQAKFVVCFANGHAVFISSDYKYGVVNSKGAVVINPEYKDMQITPFNDLYAVKNTEGKWGYVNLQGEIIINPQFDNLTSDSYDKTRFLFQKGEKWGVADNKGQYIINPQFDKILSDKDGYLVLKDYKWGWCNKEGQYTINPQYRNAYIFGDSDLAPVQTDDGDWGYIDHTGKIIINPQFANATQFNDDYAFVSSGAKSWGVIDTKGKYIINPQFEKIYPFMNGAAVVKNTDGYWGLVNNKGNYLTKTAYTSISKDLQYNYTGGKHHLLASGDFLDMEAILNQIDLFAKGINWENTIGNIKDRYSITNNNFDKSTGSATLRTKSVPETYLIKEMILCMPWSKKSDGWFGYKYIFNDQCLPNAYEYTITLLGRHKNKLPILNSAIHNKLGLKDNAGSFGNSYVEIVALNNKENCLKLIFTKK